MLPCWSAAAAQARQVEVDGVQEAQRGGVHLILIRRKVGCIIIHICERSWADQCMERASISSQGWQQHAASWQNADPRASVPTSCHVPSSGFPLTCTAGRRREGIWQQGCTLHSLRHAQQHIQNPYLQAGISGSRSASAATQSLATRPRAGLQCWPEVRSKKKSEGRG